MAELFAWPSRLHGRIPVAWRGSVPFPRWLNDWGICMAELVAWHQRRFGGGVPVGESPPAVQKVEDAMLPVPPGEGG